MLPLKRLFMALLLMCMFLPLMWVLTHHDPELIHMKNSKSLQYQKHHLSALKIENSSSHRSNNKQTSKLNVKNNESKVKYLNTKVLVVCRVKSSKLVRQVQYILTAQRVEYDVYATSSYIAPNLLDTDDVRYTGKYSVIIMVDIIGTLTDPVIYGIFNEYCNIFGAAIVFITAPLHKSSKNVDQFVVGDAMKLVDLSQYKNKSVSLTVSEKPYFKYLRDGGEYEWKKSASELTSLEPIQLYLSGQQHLGNNDDSERQTLISARVMVPPSNHHQALPVVIIDWNNNGEGYTKGYCGVPLTTAFGKLALMEMLHLIPEQQQKPVLRFFEKRYIQIDVDDVFFAPPGFNPTKEDIKELINVQKMIQQQYMPGFKFNMGFCGIHYLFGSTGEVEGKKELVKNAEKFSWFDHTYSHVQPHKIKYERLVEEMSKNKKFAQEHNIPLTHSQYSVSPHHSGVYPVYEPLYRAWKEIWNITVTSTEEYPHFKPPNMRNGFIYDNIRVLPRQTCGIYTRISRFSDLKGGKASLDSIAVDGEVFISILHNPISVFMTHYNNYGSDRLALRLFKTAFSFLKQWTKLELVYDTPTQLAEVYFKIFPENMSPPLWSMPCLDQRHLDIYHYKNCTQSPSLVIVGPQKTGSTALHFFLKQHPSLVPNYPTKHAFEEIQFFSSDYYYSKGIEWYSSLFPVVNKSVMLFEKSATYFTRTVAPQRIHSFNPNMKIIVILADPIKRAYSWYQHMRSHNDHTAMKYNFTQVIAARKELGAPPSLLNLRNRCLNPGLYYQHLMRWLEYFAPNQIYFVDGDQLTDDPVNVLFQVIHFLGLRTFDYREILRFSPRKGFYCIKNMQNKEMCLGVSKGRRYPDIPLSTVKYLSKYYSHHNRMLYKLLLTLSVNPPSWLNRSFTT